MILNDQKNDTNEYIERLAPIILIGAFWFMIFMVFAIFCVWFDLPNIYLVKVGIGALFMQIICGIFYVVRAWKDHGN